LKEQKKKEKEEKKEKLKQEKKDKKRAREEEKASKSEAKKESKKSKKEKKKASKEDEKPVEEVEEGPSPVEEEFEEGQPELTPGGTAVKAFQRVKADDWMGKKGSWDNSYEGTFGQQGWGFKAQQILGKVRGKDFRHEKTKKKRGSYRGGLIDSNAVCSYKFESDDE
jgi:outer membrane biosynthesis protein TonB